MLFPRRFIPWRPLRRRLAAGVTLCAYLVAIFGCPLPAAAHKDTDQPFPCQDHPCGCQTAEQCWTKCCCFTPEQRWAWAEAHHVRPPAYAEKPAGRGWRSGRLRDRDHGAEDAPTSCRHCVPPGQTVPAPKSCCTTHQGEPSCSEAPKPGNVKPNPAPNPRTAHGGKSGKPSGARGGVRWGLGVSAMSCQGLNTLWATTGAALPARPPLAWSPCLAPSDWTPARGDSALLLPSNPLDPPPRGLLA